MKRIVLCLVIALGASAASPRAQTDIAAAAAQVREVREAERAFAKTMADRDHAAFATFLADEAIFMPDQGPALRGRQAVADAWKRFFMAPQPPFSWEPERAEVLDNATLGMTSGPVRDPQGKRIGTFNSVWRRDASGAWKIVFDKGCPACDCK